MSLIIGENVGQTYGAQVVLRNASFRVAAGDRIGLVGPNGEGKTTLLRIIAGSLESTAGQVHRSRGLRMGYLPQTPPTMDHGTVYDAMLDVFAGVRQLEQELQVLAGQLSERPDDPDFLKRYGQLQAELEVLGGYDYTTRIEQVLSGLGFAGEMRSQPLAELSGGQRTRVYLATLLLTNPDVLLLDEPTNHLDLDSVEWLEGWLRSFKGALIVVSHDRYFLDHVTENTWEVAFGALETYRGRYSEYVKQREQRRLERQRQWEAQEKYVAETRDFIARFLAGQRSKEAQGRRTRLERFLRDEAIERPRERATIHINLASGGRTGDFVFRAEDLVIGYDSAKPLVRIERLEVQRDQRVAIVGANGTGKTTLLKTLLGQLKALGGTVRPGANVKVGYLSQTHAELDPEITAVEAVMAARKNCTEEQARSVLGSVLLSGDDALKKISQLSGGQRSRVALARLMMQSINVLFLDEPTNHLDIPSTEIMQDVLQDFGGTIVFVSHDRYLVQAVATHIWAIVDGEIRCVPGKWDDYVAWREKRRTQAAAASPEQKAKDGRKVDYQQAKKEANQIQRLKRRHEEIETEIQAAEKDLANLNIAISAAGEQGNLDRVQKLGDEYQKKDQRLKALWSEWEQVGEELELKLRSSAGPA